MDFAKAVDKVPHNRLIQKMEKYGMKGPPQPVGTMLPVQPYAEWCARERSQHGSQ